MAMGYPHTGTIAFWVRPDPSNKMDKCCQGLVATDYAYVEISGNNEPGVNFLLSTDRFPPNPFVPCNCLAFLLNGSLNSLHTITRHTFRSTAGASGERGMQVPSGHWTCVVATWGEGKMNMYKDGVPMGSPQTYWGSPPAMGPDSYLSIGSEDGRRSFPEAVGSRYFHGSIDAVRLYNHSLSLAEIHYEVCVDPPQPIPGECDHKDALRRLSHHQLQRLWPTLHKHHWEKPEDWDKITPDMLRKWGVPTGDAAKFELLQEALHESVDHVDHSTRPHKHCSMCLIYLKEAGLTHIYPILREHGWDLLELWPKLDRELLQSWGVKDEDISKA
eukprot:gene10468-1900_t